VATNAQLKVANNLVQTTLSVAIDGANTILFVASTAGFVANSLISVDKEIMAVASVSAAPNPSLTIASGGRGFDGTSPVAHSPGAKVSMYIDAWHHNSVAAEVIAIEAALGPSLQNVSSAWRTISSKYIFNPQQPGVALAPGNNVITLTPVPAGVNGTDVNHYLYISGGTGAAEAALIVGGTAVAGAASGQIIVQCANAHSGAWTIQSATSGIREALVAGIDANGRGSVYVPAGLQTIHGMLYIPPNHSFTLTVDGELYFSDTGSADGIWIDSSRLSVFEFNAGINYLGTGNCVKAYGLNPDPTDGINQIDSSQFRFTNINGTSNCLSNFYALGASNHDGYGNFSHNHVAFTTLTNAHNCLFLEGGSNNVRGAVQENLFTSTSIIGFTVSGLRMDSPGGLVNNNQFQISTIYDNNFGPSPTAGIWFSAGPVLANLFLLNNVSMETGQVALLLNAGSNNKFIIPAGLGGSVTCPDPFTEISIPKKSSIAPIYATGSPYVYQNKDFGIETLIVDSSGASITLVQMSPDGNLYYNTGMNSGVYMLNTGEFIKFTYTGTPAIYKLYKSVP
jgi:hypothetical protein